MNGDGAWKHAIAPVLPWLKATWTAITEPATAPISAVLLRSYWLNARPQEATTWAKSCGPLQRLVLSLRRINWSAPEPFTWLDDKGMEIRLTQHSPRMVADMMKAAIQRLHERSAASKLHDQEQE